MSWANQLARWKKLVVGVGAALAAFVSAWSAAGSFEPPWVSKSVYAADIKDLKARQDHTDLLVLKSHQFQLYGRMLDLQRMQDTRRLSRAEAEYLHSLTEEYKEATARIEDLQRKMVKP